ncbi:MAG: GtrA family protein [Stackebrandtia sp.]
MGVAKASQRDAPARSAASAWPLRLYRRFAELLHELGKFASVGAVAYTVDTSVFNLAHYVVGWDEYSSKVVATVFGATVAFIGNRYWTWRDLPRSSLPRQYLWYFFFNAVGLGITLFFVWLYMLGVDRWPGVLDNPLALNLAANVVGVGFASLFRFYAYRTWVFVDRTETPDDAK